MNLDGIRIWKNIENGEYAFNLRDVTEVLNGREQLEIEAIDVSNANPIYLETFNNNSTYALNEAKYVVIPRTVSRKLSRYILDNNLSEASELIFLICVCINNEIAEWQNVLSDGKEGISHDLKNIEKDKGLLEKIISEYKAYYYPPTLSNSIGEIKNISFTFSHLTSSIKITNPILLARILDCLKDSFDMDEVSKIDYSKIQTSFKHQISNSLLQLFIRPSMPWTVCNQAEVHRKIVTIFSLAGVDTNEVTVKQWITRSSL